jgi:hypothetical protein
MNPEDLAKSGTESGHQRAVFAWAALSLNEYPELRWMFHIPNGGERTARGAMNLKAEGVKRGVSDIMLPVTRGRYAGLFIEMKKPGEINKTTKEQNEFGEFISGQHYLYMVCDNWMLAKSRIIEYLKLI